MFRYVYARYLTCQRKHLVHSDPGPERCITQVGLAMLCRAIGALASENDIAGFELPIPWGSLKVTDCYSVDTPTSARS